jgi:hypothetical protein
MRHLAFDETTAVVGAAGCEDLTLSIGLNGPSVGGSFGAWVGCFDSLLSGAADTLYGYWTHHDLGIPYGAAHVG